MGRLGAGGPARPWLEGLAFLHVPPLSSQSRHVLEVVAMIQERAGSLPMPQDEQEYPHTFQALLVSHLLVCPLGQSKQSAQTQHHRGRDDSGAKGTDAGRPFTGAMGKIQLHSPN